MHMMSYVKVCSSTTYDTLLAKFGELLIKLYVLKLAIGLKQRFAYLPSTMWKVSGDLFVGKPMTTQPRQIFIR